ncbi:MAG: MFS transporter [Tractidigestivibacter sp.]|jgi:MFS family permease|uniref:MFS transporter n=1 Tax=Tractidigestivibacter sp. TaxID=2847320 RepID=UPI003D8F6450
MKKVSLKIDGRFYYGWIMMICGFMSMFICYVIKVNCQSLFYTPICDDLGVSKTAYIQTNTIMTVTMMIGSLFIGKLYKKYKFKYVLSACVAITSICYLLMSRATSLWQLYLLAAIQGFGWCGATNLPATILMGNWFGPKVKGTALSLAMLGSGAGALVWVRVVNSAIVSGGWRYGYLVMAGINAIMIPIALLLVVATPSEKGFDHRIGDPEPGEVSGQEVGEKAGITASQALHTARWWLQWLAGMITMIGAAAFSAQFVAHYTEITGSSDQAAALYSTVLGTLIIGKFLVGVISDVISIRRMAVIVPLFYAAVFVCMTLSSQNMMFAYIMMPLYMIGGALPSTVPFLITARNFGDKEYGVLSGWMNIAGNVGQIVGPTVAALIFDVTGTYNNAWIVFAFLMIVVSVLYGLSSKVSQKQIESMGYTPR